MKKITAGLNDKILEVMDYEKISGNCFRCTHFVEDDEDFDDEEENEDFGECTINKALLLCVNKDGVCSHYEKKKQTPYKAEKFKDTYNYPESGNSALKQELQEMKDALQKKQAELQIEKCMELAKANQDESPYDD